MDRFQKIALGTVESLVVELTDRLENITDLSTHNARYSVMKLTDSSLVYDDEPATLVAGMTVYCRIDTLAVADEEGDYDLFVRLTVGGDSPYLYCGRFRVD